MPHPTDDHDLLFEQVHGFVTAALENRVTPAQVAEFEAVLSSNPAAMRIYQDYMTEMVGLHWLVQEHGMSNEHGAASSASADADDAGFDLSDLAALEDRASTAELVDLTDRFKNAPRRRTARLRPAHTEPGPRVLVIPRPLIYLATAAVIALVAMVGYQLNKPTTTPDRQTDRQTPHPATPAVLATLGQSLDARWSTPLPGTSRGQQLQSGTYQLDSGLAEIELQGGSRVVIEGPARFELLSTSRLRLIDGRIVGHCPAGSEGLTVLAGQTRVVDLGTAFGVSMRPMMPLDVQVFDGEVMVATARPDGVAAGESDDGAHRLVAGQAVSVMPQTGEVRPAAFDPQAYVTQADPQALALRQYAQAVRNAEPLCYWPLDPTPAQGPGANAISGQPDLHIAGTPRFVRNGEHLYLRFTGVPDGPSDFLYTAERIEALQGATDLTVEAWVRPIRRHRGIVFNFFDPGQNEDAGFASHVAFLEFVGDPFAGEQQSERNKMSLWLDALATPGAPGEAVSNREYPLNQWLHVVAVIRADQLLLFIDGQRVAERSMAARFQVAPALSFAALANELAEPIPGQHKVPRRLAGDLDQLAVYRYAMPPDVIAKHYRLMSAAVTTDPTTD